MSQIELLLNGVNIWPSVLLDAEFSAKTNGAPGTCRLRIKDQTLMQAVEVGDTLQLTVDGEPAWTGWVIGVRRSYFAPVVPTVDAQGVPFSLAARQIIIEGVDLNYLMTRRFLYDRLKPTNTEFPTYPADTLDATILANLFSRYIDLDGDDIDTSSRVDAVGPVSILIDANPLEPGYSWAATMERIARTTQAVFYIDPSRRLVYADIDGASSSTVLTDQPSGPNDVGYRDFELIEDATKMINDMLVWGAALGVDRVRFGRSTDASSVAEHDRWQSGDYTIGLYHQQYINQRAASFVYGSPQSLRGGKDPAITVKLTVFDTPVMAGERYTVRNEVFGYEDVLPVREVRMTFPTPTSVRYDASLSFEIDEPWSYFETYWRFEPPPSLPVISGPPVMLRVLDSFSRSLLPQTSFAGPIFNPGWGQGEILTWNTPEHPANSYSVSGGYGHLTASYPNYVLGNEEANREVSAPLDGQSDLRNLLIKFRLGRWLRLYGSTNQYWSGGGPAGSATVIIDGSKAYDVVSETTLEPDMDTYAYGADGTVSIGQGGRKFGATPIVPAGGSVEYTVALGSAPYVGSNVGEFTSLTAPFVDGNNTGGEVVPDDLRDRGVTTALGAATEFVLPPVNYAPPLEDAQDFRLNALTFVGTDLPSLDYPWDMHFWFEVFGHKLTFSRYQTIGKYGSGSAGPLPDFAKVLIELNWVDSWITFSEFQIIRYLWSQFLITAPGAVTTTVVGQLAEDRDNTYLTFAGQLQQSWLEEDVVPNPPPGLGNDVQNYMTAQYLFVQSDKVLDEVGEFTIDIRGAWERYKDTWQYYPPYDPDVMPPGFEPAGDGLLNVRTHIAVPVATVSSATLTDPYTYDDRWTLTTTSPTRPWEDGTDFNLYARNGFDAYGPGGGVAGPQYYVAINDHLWAVDGVPFGNQNVYNVYDVANTLAWYTGPVDINVGDTVYLLIPWSTPVDKYEFTLYPDTWPYTAPSISEVTASATAIDIAGATGGDISGPYPPPGDALDTDFYGRWNGAAGYTFTSEASFRFEPDTDYWGRFFIDGNGSIQARFWADGTSEQQTWDVYKRTTASGGEVGPAVNTSVSGGDDTLKIGVRPFPFQTYALDVDLIATARTAVSVGVTPPLGSSYLCETAIPLYDGAPVLTSPHSYTFQTSRPYLPGLLMQVTVDGVLLTKGTHYREITPSTGVFEIMAGVTVMANRPSPVNACYYYDYASTGGGGGRSGQPLVT